MASPLTTFPTAAPAGLVHVAATPESVEAAAPPDGVVQRKRWTREEYFRLGEQGWFDDVRVELIDGEIVQAPPPSESHLFTVDLLRELLTAIFGKGYWVRSEGCVAPTDVSQLQPDIAVIEGDRQLLADHPSSALLTVEVSKSTQWYDKTTKAHLYASAGVPDYWVLDLERRDLTVFREPREDAASPFGWRYTQITVLDATQEVSPLARPDSKLSVGELLPHVVGA